MPIGMEVGLGPGNFVFDGGPATPEEKAQRPPTQFLAHVCCGEAAGWIKMPLGTEVTVCPGDVVLDGVAAPHEKGHPVFGLSVYVYCGQTVGWMKTPVGMEVDLDPGHIVLDVVPTLRERVTAAPPSFRPMSIVDTVTHFIYF